MRANGIKRRGSARERETVSDEVSDLVFRADDNECKICENWFDIECQKLTKTTYNILLRISRSREKSKVHWYCVTYDVGAGKIFSAVIKISQRLDKMEEKMRVHEKESASVKQQSRKPWKIMNPGKAKLSNRVPPCRLLKEQRVYRNPVLMRER